MAESMLNNVGAVTTGDPTSISTGAQDIAKAQGVNYEDIAKTVEDSEPVQWAQYDATATGDTVDTNTEYQPAANYVDEAKSTVAGQLTTLLDENSAYIQQARNQATEQAAGRGLLNSTMAANAGQRAAIGSALPIAQQDAQTWANAFGQQQQAEYGQETIKTEAIVSGGLIEQKADIERKNLDINNAFQARIQGADAQNTVWLQDFQNQFNEGMEILGQAHQENLLTTELDSNSAENLAEETSLLMQNYQISVENMLQDPDFLNMGDAAVNNALKQMQNLTYNAIGLVGATKDVNMTAWLDSWLEETDYIL